MRIVSRNVDQINRMKLPYPQHHNIRFDVCVMDRKAAISSEEASVMSECECLQLTTLLKDKSFPQMERTFVEFRESDISVEFTLKSVTFL